MSRVNDIILEMEKIAPTYLKEDFDNVGLMVGDRNKEVKKILLALDCTLSVIHEGKSNEVDLIITHHPLIFRKPSSITTDTLQGRKIIELIKSDIALYSSHTNLDSVERGLNSTIVTMLGFEGGEIIEPNSRNNKAGLGRVVALDKQLYLEEIVEIIKSKLNIKQLRVVKGKEKVSKIAIINGSGQDFIGKAMSMGADCVITGDTTYHFASDYKEMGISIIDVGHFASEQIIFFEVMNKLKEKFNNIEFLTSKMEEDPYTFI